MFAFDIDRTVIFSDKALDDMDMGVGVDQLVAVEYKGDYRLSYTSLHFIKKLKELNKVCACVPVTMRSKEQYQRIDCFKHLNYAIVANGGWVWCKKDMTWFRPYSDKIIGVCTEDLSNCMNEICADTEIKDNVSILRNVDESFIFLKTYSRKFKRECTNNEYNMLEENGHQCVLDKVKKIVSKYTRLEVKCQGLKVYITCRCISKDKTLKLIKGITGCSEDEKLYVAGDSMMDIEMLKAADVAYSYGHLNTLKNEKGSFIYRSLDDTKFIPDELIDNIISEYDKYMLMV